MKPVKCSLYSRVSQRYMIAIVSFTAGENSIIIVGGANTAEWELGEEASQVTALFSAPHYSCHDTQVVGLSAIETD